MYTNEQLRDMDKGALVCLVGALQDKIAAARPRYVQMTNNIGDDNGFFYYLESADMLEFDNLFGAADHLRGLYGLSDSDLITRTLDAINQ